MAMSSRKSSAEKDRHRESPRPPLNSPNRSFPDELPPPTSSRKPAKIGHQTSATKRNSSLEVETKTKTLQDKSGSSHTRVRQHSNSSTNSTKNNDSETQTTKSGVNANNKISNSSKSQNHPDRSELVADLVPTTSTMAANKSTEGSFKNMSERDLQQTKSVQRFSSLMHKLNELAVDGAAQSSSRPNGLVGLRPSSQSGSLPWPALNSTSNAIENKHSTLNGEFSASQSVSKLTPIGPSNNGLQAQPESSASSSDDDDDEPVSAIKAPNELLEEV